MKTVNLRQLRNAASAVLRMAREQPVVVLKRNQPEALLVHLDHETLLREPGVRVALATALYRSGSLTLGRAARVARMALAEFMQHVSRLGIPAIRGTAQSVRSDVANLEAWRKKPFSATRSG